MDMFAPISMRLHPLTRIITPPLPATPEIEARLECTDQMGDITKGVGSVSFQLCSWEFASLSHQGPRLATWISDITTPDHNKLHWDPITRTYLFHLPLEASIPLSPGKKYVLLATLHFTNNTQLTDDIVLTIK